MQQTSEEGDGQSEASETAQEIANERHVRLARAIGVDDMRGVLDGRGPDGNRRTARHQYVGRDVAQIISPLLCIVENTSVSNSEYMMALPRDHLIRREPGFAGREIDDVSRLRRQREWEEFYEADP